jgi:ABC-type glycerol-3-phosphate transport system substrate-binding protein
MPSPTFRPLVVVFLYFLAFPGCTPPKNEPSPENGQTALTGVKLQLLIVDDPALTRAVERMRGQWQSETGSELTVRQAEAKSVGSSEALDADAAVIPSALLAPLAERGLVAPLPQGFDKNPTWGDIFELLKLREAAWGEKSYAVPLGSPLFVLYYRADLLEKIGGRSPKTWKEYQDLSQQLAGEKPGKALEWSGNLEPLAPGWAGLVFLARAASYAKHRDNYSTLFDVQTMEPLIDGPPFIKALQELVATDKPAANEMLRLDPAGVRRAFWEGKCGMAMTWPSAAGILRSAQDDNRMQDEKGARDDKREGKAKTDGKSLPGDALGITDLPGSVEVYSRAEGDWVRRGERESPKVPLLAVAGRLGVVSARSERQDAAFRLLLWLADEKNSGKILPGSPATTLFRKSQQNKPQLWGEPPIPAKILSDYADLLAKALRREQWLAFRLPGREEYLAALDEAVRSAVQDQSSPAEALRQAAARWREITEKRGKEAQRKAYLHSLGLEE